MMKINGKNFVCDECPICDGLDYRLNIAEECGCDPQIEYCYCDKVGHKFYAGGFCEDAFSCEVQSKTKKSKLRNCGIAYRRKMKGLKRNKRMKIISHGYKPTAGYVDWDMINGEWVPVGTYIKYPKNSNMQKFFKRYSNRINRRKEIPVKGNGYRKNFDYWRTLY